MCCHGSAYKDARHEVFTVVTVKVTVFLDMTPYSLVEIYRHFGGTHCPHIQKRRIRTVGGRRVLNLYQTELHHIPEDSNLQ